MSDLLSMSDFVIYSFSQKRSEMFLLEEIDKEYEEAHAIRIAQHVEAEQSFGAEIRYIFGNENDADN